MIGENKEMNYKEIMGSILLALGLLLIFMIFFNIIVQKQHINPNYSDGITNWILLFISIICIYESKTIKWRMSLV